MVEAMKRTVCEQNKCAGCMACVEMCPKNAINIVDTRTAYNAEIDQNKCVQCGICTKVCHLNQKVERKHPQSWYQGWIDDVELRKKSSSGGAAKALSRRFVEDGGVVVSCCFRNGVFGFESAQNFDELEKFTGSKYVKSNPFGVYKKVQSLLKQGRKVLFIGLPCQVGALKTVTGENEQLYTVDLICHGTPSPKLLGDYLALHKVKLEEISSISFRYKDVFGLAQNRIPLSQPGSCDNYLLAFLCGLDYTDSCYECKYAGINRCSDITIGDSWGSDLRTDEQKRGISLILCQTLKGEDLLKRSKMKLFPVNLEHAVSVNDQLKRPSPKTKKHDLFFEKYPRKNFSYATFCCLPSKCMKQRIKATLLKMKILRGGMNYNISITK